MNERITVTLALSVTVDPDAWYYRHRADPGIDIPDRMLSHLRTLPGIPELGGKVELTRFVRRGSRHCRQSPQHRAVIDDSWRVSARAATLTGGQVAHLVRRQVSCGTTYAIRCLRQALPAPGVRIPNEPSGKFL